MVVVHHPPVSCLIVASCSVSCFPFCLRQLSPCHQCSFISPVSRCHLCVQYLLSRLSFTPCQFVTSAPPCVSVLSWSLYLLVLLACLQKVYLILWVFIHSVVALLHSCFFFLAYWFFCSFMQQFILILCLSVLSSSVCDFLFPHLGDLLLIRTANQSSADGSCIWVLVLPGALP